MLESNSSMLNRFLVEIFNEILKIEENCLSAGNFENLSVREIHVIDTVCSALDRGGSTKATDIAESLKVTAGTLSTSVSLLEKKGYLVRKKDISDKRIVRINPTALGREAYELHTSFHNEMVEDVISILTSEEQMVLIRALSAVSAFFRAKEKTKLGRLSIDPDYN